MPRSRCLLFVFVLAASGPLAGGEEDTTSTITLTHPGKGVLGESAVELHGWATAVYGDFERGFARSSFLPPPGTQNLADTDDGSFTSDFGLWLAAPVHPQVRVYWENHWFDNGSTSAVYETRVQWQPCPAYEHLRIVAGRFFLPFGIHEEEWNSGRVHFLALPNASVYLPPHVIDTGLRLEGELLGASAGLKYALAVSNGFSGFYMIGDGTDGNRDKTLSARLGFIPFQGEGRQAEIGVSWLQGDLRDAALTGNIPGTSTAIAAASSELAHPADLRAYGLDLRAELERLTLRGYWGASSEGLGDVNAPPVRDLDRSGLLLEGLYTVLRDAPCLGRVRAKLRYDQGEQALFAPANGAPAGSTSRKTTLAYGVNCYPAEQLTLRAEYYTQDESGSAAASIKDDGFAASFSVEF